MIVALKTLHLLALAAALGGGLCRLLLMRAAARGGTDPRALALPQRWLAHLSTGGVAVLWLTGLALWLGGWRGVDLGAAFHLKLAAATLLLILSGYGWTRMMAGNPPSPPLARSLVRGGVLLGIAAVLLAATAFST